MQASRETKQHVLKDRLSDKWRTTSAYEVDRGLIRANIFRGNQFAFHRDLAKIGQPVDRGEWEMTPPHG